MKLIVALISGLLFSLGLTISGMTQPDIVIGFLDPMDWNPTLAFVMFGALLVHAPAYYFLKNKKKPVLDYHWHLPRENKVTLKLIFGSMIFGVGWGMAGYCPGPAVVSLSTGSIDVFGFVLMMIAGMTMANIILRRLP